jgi:hypothetical protein
MTARRDRSRHASKIDSLNHLHTLGHDLDRQRDRVRRARRNYEAIDREVESVAATAAHRAWSDTVGEALEVAEAISRERARDVGELLVHFEATWWWIVEDDSVLDADARRWLERFRRSLRWLAGQN